MVECGRGCQLPLHSKVWGMHGEPASSGVSLRDTWRGGHCWQWCEPTGHPRGGGGALLAVV